MKHQISILDISKSIMICLTKCAVSLVVTLIVLLSDTYAATLQVGSGQTYSTIQAAVNASTAGDTINVHAGTYTENLSVSKALTVQRNPRDAPIIFGKITISSSVNQVVIDGFEVRSGSTDLIYSRNSNRITIKNNILHDGSGSGIVVISGHSLDSTYANGIMIDNNTIYNNGVDGIEIHGQYFTISNNSIDNNITPNWANTHPDGIQFIGASADGYSSVQHAKVYNNKISNHTQNLFTEGVRGNESSDCSDIYIYNNVIYNDSAVVNGVDMATLDAVKNLMIKWSDSVYIYNNTLGRATGNSVHLQGNKNGTIYFKNNIMNNSSGNGVYVENSNDIPANGIDYNIYNVSGNVVTWNSTGYATLSAFKSAIANQEVHGLSGDPIITSARTPMLLSNSPAINKGIPLSSIFTTDMVGTSRPQGTGWNIGAYEFIGTNKTPFPPGVFSIQ